jgi:SNF2 family DNA or RNA helicase
MATKLEISQPAGLKVLYVCPATMVGNVIAECRRWAPHRSAVSLGGKDKATRRVLLDVMTTHNEYVVVINYEAWRKDMALIDDLIKIQFDTIVIDEAHNIKDMKSIGYRGVKRLITEGNIPFVVPMTGTPILNRPQELFTLLTLVDPQRFHTLKYFLEDYCEQDHDTGKWYFRPGGLDSLAKKIAPQFLRRTKESAGIKLPPKTIIIHEVEIDKDRYPEQARCRSEMQRWGSIILDPDTKRGISAAAQIAVYTRLRQIETWPDGIKVLDPDTKEVVMQVSCQESQKIDEIINVGKPSVEKPLPYGVIDITPVSSQPKQYVEPTGLLPEVVEEERVVIFSQFKEPLHELQRRCEIAGIRSVIMDGDTPNSVRDEVRKDFDVRETPDRTKAKWDVVLCNYKVGGVGLNFTAATQMIVLDEEWNPGKRDQAYDRIHRIGQDKPVTIHVLRARIPGAWGIDVWLADLIEQKEDLVGGFMNATDMAAAALDALRKGQI